MAKVPYVSNNAESKICATRVPTGILLGVYFGMSLHPTHYPIGSALTKPMCATFCARSRARKDNSSNTHRCAQYEYVEHFLLRRHARIALSSGEEGLLRPNRGETMDVRRIMRQAQSSASDLACAPHTG